MLASKPNHDDETDHVRDPRDALIPVDSSVSAKRHLDLGSASVYLYAIEERHTANVIRLIITIPRVLSTCVDTLPKVWPPMMQLRTRNPCMEKTLRIAGIHAGKYLGGMLSWISAHLEKVCITPREPRLHHRAHTKFGPEDSAARIVVSGSEVERERTGLTRARE